MSKLSTPITFIILGLSISIRVSGGILARVFVVVGAMLVDEPLPLAATGCCEVTGGFPLFDVVRDKSKELMFGA